MSLERVSEVFTVVLAVVYLLLPVTYWVLAKTWYRSQTGRALMWLLASLAIAMLYVAAGVLYGQHEGRLELRFFTYAIMLGAGVRFGAYMFQTQVASAEPRALHDTTAK